MQTNGKVFNGVKVFSATTVQDRNALGEKVTDWLRQNPHIEIVDKQITQSSDSSYHCITISLFYYEDTNAKKKEVPSGGGTGRARQAAGKAPQG